MIRFQILILLFFIPKEDLAAATCPSGTHGPSPENRCYKISESTYNYPNGLSYCASNSMHSPVILSSAENQYIRQFISSHTWIGGTDAAVEGTFIWSATGKNFTYTNWANGEPNDTGNNEDCVDMSSSGLWNDIPCLHGEKCSVRNVVLRLRCP